MNTIRLLNNLLSMSCLRALVCSAALCTAPVMAQPTLSLLSVSPTPNRIIPLGAGPATISATFNADLATLPSGKNPLFVHPILSAFDLNPPDVAGRVLSARLLQRPLPGDMLEATLTTNVQSLSGALLGRPY